MDNEKKYIVVDSKTTRLGRFQIRLDTVDEKGKRYPYSYIEQKNSVGILGLYEDKIILIKQYRHSLNSYEYEIPGGGIEGNENPTQVAYREMLEETGYEIESIDELGTYYPSPGSSNELCYLFFAKCIKKKEPSTEPLEYINVELFNKKDFVNMIETGLFKHSMGLVAWLKYEMKKDTTK